MELVLEIGGGFWGVIWVAGEMPYADGKGDDEVVVLECQCLGRIHGDELVGRRIVLWTSSDT